MAEFKLSYTAKEINAKLEKVDNLVSTINGVKPDENGNINIEASGGDAIIDVLELPMENINSNAFYRLLTARFCTKDYIPDNTTHCYCVDTLPEIGDVVSNASFNFFIGYYNVSDGVLYGYVDAALGSAFGVSAGWYPFEALAQVAGLEFNGVIVSQEDLPDDNNFYAVLLERELYTYKDGWTKVIAGYEILPKIDIRWNGDMTGRPTLDMSLIGYNQGTYCVKVSDEIPEKQDLLGGVLCLNVSDTEEIFENQFDTESYPGAYTISNWVIVVYSVEDLNAALGIPEGIISNGIWFTRDDNYGYTTILRGPSKTRKIDEKFLPDIDTDALGLHSVAMSGNYYDLWNRPTIYTDVVRYNTTQGLNDSYKRIARNNIDVYSKSEVDSKISGANLSNYYNKAEVDAKIDEAIGSAIGGSY